jgi:cation-transporting P-type ATPase 13A2
MPQLSPTKAQKIKRQEAEKDLVFLGFIVFENKLKAGTAAAITKLNDAHIRNVMCTGDNILTAISVARECQLLKDSAFVFVPRFLENGGATNPLQTVIWENMDNPDITLDANTLLPLLAGAQINHDSPYDKHGITDYAVAVTGEVFRWMVDFASRETLQRALVKGVVFARMSPDEKAELVEKTAEYRALRRFLWRWCK